MKMELKKTFKYPVASDKVARIKENIKNKRSNKF